MMKMGKMEEKQKLCSAQDRMQRRVKGGKWMEMVQVWMN